MNKMSRSIYNSIVADKEAVKAIAMLVFIKSKFRSSVITNFSYYKLAKITSMHQETVKRRFKTLESMNLVERIGKHKQHVIFKKVRAEISNVVITKIEKTTVKNIEVGLRSLFIVEKVRQKEYVKHHVKVSSRNTKTKKVKRSRKVCDENGYHDFIDFGISYNYIAKKLRIGRNTTSNIIKYAESHNMIVKHNNVKHVGFMPNVAMLFVHEAKDDSLFATRHNIYKKACNTYTLPKKRKR